MEPSACLEPKFQSVVNKVLRGLHERPISSPTWGLLLHYGCLPLQFRIFKQVLQFWNSLLQMQSPLMHHMCQLACDIAQQPQSQDAWLSQLLTACAALCTDSGMFLPTGQDSVMASPCQISWQMTSKALRDFYQRYLQNAYCNIPHTQPDCQHRKHAALCQCLHRLDGHTWSNASLVLNMSCLL